MANSRRRAPGDEATSALSLSSCVTLYRQLDRCENKKHMGRDRGGCAMCRVIAATWRHNDRLNLFDVG